MANALLVVDDLRITYQGSKTKTEAVRGVSFNIAPGEVLGLVGASGSGKSSLVNAILGLHRLDTRVDAQALTFEGHDLLRADTATWSTLRGRRLGLIPQHPMTSLAATTSVGRQFDWYLGDNAIARYADDLVAIGLDEVVERPDDLPSKFSGGQLQRLVIAIATFGASPSLLLADEPTSTLDTTVQQAVLQVLEEQRQRLGIAMLYISHDLAVVSQVCDRVGVMKDGQLIEIGTVADIFNSPQHQYTKALVSSISQMALAPRSEATTFENRSEATNSPASAPVNMSPPSATKAAVPLLSVRDVTHQYSTARSEAETLSLQNASLELKAGEIVALVGQSGSGKTTLARIIAGAQMASSGEVWFKGEELSFNRPASLRRQIQLVSQNQRAALNAHRSVKHALLQALRVHNIGTNHADQLQIATEMLERVGLTAGYLDRKPTQLSGGELARTVLARALLLSPELLILDEPTASLDGPVKLLILRLLKKLQSEMGLTVLIITHELTVARKLSERVVVMNSGQIVETGATATVFTKPTAEYTRALIESEPKDPRLV